MALNDSLYIERGQQSKSHPAVRETLRKLEREIIGGDYKWRRNPLPTTSFRYQIDKAAAAVMNARHEYYPNDSEVTAKRKTLLTTLEGYVAEVQGKGSPDCDCALLNEKTGRKWGRRALWTALGIGTLVIGAETINNITNYAFNQIEGNVHEFVWPPTIDLQLIDYIPRLWAEGEEKLNLSLSVWTLGNALATFVLAPATFLATRHHNRKQKEKDNASRREKLREIEIPICTNTTSAYLSNSLFPPETLSSPER